MTRNTEAVLHFLKFCHVNGSLPAYAFFGKELFHLFGRAANGF